MGAVPAALNFLLKQSAANNTVSKSFDVSEDNSGHIVYYICPKPYDADVQKRIVELYKDNPHIELKEHCGLHEYFFPGRFPEYSKKNQGWIELDNGFIFFVNEQMYKAFDSLLNESAKQLTVTP